MPTQFSHPAGQAVVIGGSIAGLLAARVLSETFDRVTIVDRDVLPIEPTHRKGVPQSRHTHGLLVRGYQIFEELFPGFSDDLMARGAAATDMQNDIIWFNEGRRMLRAPSAMTALLASRPLLESYVRSRILALSNVDLMERTEVVGLRQLDGRLTGVDLAHDGAAGRLEAQIVVDATGRSNRAPTWLAALGYPAAPEEVVNPGLVHVTREYRRVPGAQDFTSVLIGHHPGNPVATGTAATDGDRWLVTLLGLENDCPPAEPGAFEAFAARLDGPEVHRLVTTAEPLTEPVRFRIGPNVRRRYERCARLPEGFIAVGDSLCCFNPAYAQGMSTAAMAAGWLRTCLRSGTSALTKRYFRGVAKIVDVPWEITVGADLRFPSVAGHRTRKIKFLNAYLSRLHLAAQTDPVVGATFLKVANFLAPPQKLMSPGMIWRVLRGSRDRAAANPG